MVFEEDIWHCNNEYIKFPLVSVVTTCFKAGEFIDAFMEDIVAQSIFNKIELLIVDSASPQKESAVILPYLQKFKNIKLMRTSVKETPAEAINRCIDIAQSRFIALAMMDDRHRFDALEIMANELLLYPEIALVYADSLNTNKPNDTFPKTEAKLRRVWGENAHQHIRRYCGVGQHPMYRRELHDLVGGYDIDVPWACDWEFYLHVIEKCQAKFKKINQVLSLYYINPNGVENSHPEASDNVNKIIERYAIDRSALGSPGQTEYILTEDERKVDVRQDRLVSIVVNCCGVPAHLTECMDSIYAQKLENAEVIIVNVLPDFNEQEVAESYRQSSPDIIRVINANEVGNFSAARNRGLLAATGKYVLCLDSADKLAPSVLNKLVGIIDSDDSINFIYTDRFSIDADESVTQAQEYDFEALKYTNYIPYCALMRADVWVRVGGYKTNVYDAVWDFWLALGCLGVEGHYLSTPLFLERPHADILANKANEIFSQLVLNHKAAYSEDEINKAKICLVTKPLDFSKALLGDNKFPLVSVVIPTCNRSSSLQKALLSISNQSYRNWEAIVVNDGGARVSKRLISLDSRIKLIELAENHGQAYARNVALKAISGEVVCFLDDDDVFLENHLAVIVNGIKNAGFVYTRAEYIYKDESGNLIGTDIPSPCVRIVVASIKFIVQQGAER